MYIKLISITFYKTQLQLDGALHWILIHNTMKQKKKRKKNLFQRSFKVNYIEAATNNQTDIYWNLDILNWRQQVPKVTTLSYRNDIINISNFPQRM